MKRLLSLIANESGTTSIEYALIGVLISVAAVLAMLLFGNNVSTMFSTVASSVPNVPQR